MDFELSSLEHADSVLPMNSLTDAIQLQTKLVDEMTKHFTGDQFLSLGDLGVVPGKNRPKHTILVEQTLASFFQTEEAALVRGSGTGAITTLLSAILSPGEKMFIHDAPVYSTTKHTISSLGLETVIADYNDELVMKEKLLQHKDCKVFYIQHARQQPTDTYQLKQVIQFVKKVRPDITIVSDDNYCVFKTDGIAVEHGADYSTFSGFKVLGPEGVGVIVGKKKALTLIHERNYSGGSKVQGFEAMELLRMMTFAPVMFAIQNKQVEEICKRLNEGEVPGVRSAYVVNAQSKVVIVNLKEPIAEQVIENSNYYGASTHPVGAESKYEILPMIYRVSGTFLESQPTLRDYGIRINPMKSGATTVLNILDQAINRTLKPDR